MTPQVSQTDAEWVTAPATTASLPKIIAALSALVVVAVAAGLWVGEGDLDDPGMRDVLLELRGYRVLAGFLVGAAMATGGVLVQGLFRNPLASPSIIGATAGAAFGGKAALVGFELLLGGVAPAFIATEMVVPLGCFLGALLALGILLAISHYRQDRIVILLAGFLLSSLFLSLGAFVTAIAQQRHELARAVIAFTMGSVSGTSPRLLAMALPMVVFGCLAAWTWARPLDIMLSGVEEAETLGVDTREVRRFCIAWVAVLSAGAVTVGGNIGFVGLVVPHALRSVMGVSHRRLIPAAAVAGGVFVVLCDVITRLAPTESELPLGVVTGLIGAPVFLILLIREMRDV